jgi:putative polymerase
MEPKFFRDVLIMPLFMMLGLAFAGGSLTRLVLTAHVAVFAVFVLEMAAPDLYSEIFRIQDYYIGTRGLNLEEFYDTSSELFVSATRPDERFIPFIDAPRASSLFLEPVSLGNYCSIVTAFTVACWHRLGSAARLLLPISTVLMIVGCDGRLALVTCAMIVAAAPWVTSLPRRSTLLYAPLLVLAAFALTYLAELRSGTDDFAGRLANTVEFLARLDAPDLLGLTNTLIDPAVDSGITYLILTQSLPGVILLWLFITCSGSDTTPEQVRYTHALCLYLSLSMLVSYAFLTIKTASLAWFIQGALQGTMIVRSPKGRGR